MTRADRADAPGFDFTRARLLEVLIDAVRFAERPGGALRVALIGALHATSVREERGHALGRLLFDLGAFSGREYNAERLEEAEHEFLLGGEDLGERCASINGAADGGPFDVTDAGTEANRAPIRERLDGAENQSFGAHEATDARGGRGVDASRGSEVEFAQHFT